MTTTRRTKCSRAARTAWPPGAEDVTGGWASRSRRCRVGEKHVRPVGSRALRCLPAKAESNLAEYYSIALAMSSTTFLASPKTIMVLSM